MITSEHLGITTGLLLILMMLVVAVYTARVHWGVKAGLTVGCLLAVLVFHKTWVLSLGWPVEEAMPENSRFISAEVIEPVNGQEGHIFLWLVPEGSGRPRAFRVPYTRGNHRAAAQAAGQVANGQEAYVGRRTVRGRRYNNIQQDEADFDFVPPPSTVPSKN
jgi:hypothetical protein